MTEATVDERCRILVIEDDPSISLGLRINLSAEGYDVGLAEDGRSGLDRALAESWHVIILDLMLPKLNGFEVVRHLRSQGNETPVLMLSAKSAEADKVMGLELGAEDYITKPFGIAEVLARIKVALRRGLRPRVQQAASPLFTFGDVEVDVDKREVRRAGQPVEMTATEFDVLRALVVSKGSVLTRRQIFEKVWGPNHHGTPRTIDNFVAQLRAKLEPDVDQPAHLVTVRGIGYRLVR
ncbi:MAG TPA: response regulator transcription factor [Polyangiales bacterium]|nr:response regulator transcription factor [Polyangiales bacterium]